MSRVVVVTDRRLCRTDFLGRLAALAAARPAGLVLREKDLGDAEYAALAREALAICAAHGVRCVLHSRPEVALALGADALHLALPALRALPASSRARFGVLGASVHSPAEAVEAEALGCTYVTAGHVFETASKAGLPPRGLAFLRETCQAVSIPVRAIGGISHGNAAAALAAGAAGVCVMSGAMTCRDPREYIAGFPA